ncbi:MAG: hypothetical protein JRN26_08120 [Nitrososphaerota archaeon]|jgi:aromatic ring-opening dioxygenase LigB subunit|nr:hypothetical protein [Nitrososphaerota archaeon]
MDETDANFRVMREKLRTCGSKSHEISKFVIVTPHNLRVNDHLLIVYSERVCDEDKCYKVDRELAHSLFLNAKSGRLPVIEVNYGTESGKESVIPLDWGSSIPLSFFHSAKEVIIISPGRALKRSTLFRFGKMLAANLTATPDKVGIIISADHAHTHSEGGPYGYSKMAVKYDKIVMDFVNSGNASLLLDIDSRILKGARPDSYWQLLILAGILNSVKTTHEAPIYGIAGYYGMLVLEYEVLN